MSIPSREECTYTSHYCEENVWKLCHYVSERAPHDLHHFFVLFISNKDRKIPLWQQKAGVQGRQDNLVIWDYHVILIHHSPPCTLVFDQDSLLPFPCPFDQYWQQAIRPDDLLLPQFGRNFRLVAAADFVKIFASDRSHMRDPADGSWLQPPPPYPPIQTPDSSNNLHSFICMSNGPEFDVGTIFQSSESLREYFAGRRTEAAHDGEDVAGQQEEHGEGGCMTHSDP